MLGVALSPPRALDPSGLFQAVGNVGTPVPGHHETCPSFSPVLEAQGPKEGRQQVKDAWAFPGSCVTLGKLCHPQHFPVTGRGVEVSLPQESVCPGCAGMCVLDPADRNRFWWPWGCSWQLCGEGTRSVVGLGPAPCTQRFLLWLPALFQPLCDLARVVAAHPPWMSGCLSQPHCK